MNSDIILHHYDASPFTQKALRMLGLKDVTWRSVETPMVMPKPDLVCLTGGYRGTPVMQIGAEIFIDTQCIAAELEEKFPEPTLFPGGNVGLSFALVKWSDAFFQAGLTMALTLLGPDWDESFLTDRKKIFSHIDFDHIGEDLEHAMGQLRAHAALLDAQLADGRRFLTGDKPGLVDIQAFSVPWFTRGALPVTEKLLGQFKHLPPWEDRVADMGEGTREVITAEEAHGVARDSQPDLIVDVDEDDGLGLKAGMTVSVEADDFSQRGVVEGELLKATAREISLHRRDDELGDMVVHFPRLGYRVRIQN